MLEPCIIITLQGFWQHNNCAAMATLCRRRCWYRGSVFHPFNIAEEICWLHAISLFNINLIIDLHLNPEPRSDERRWTHQSAGLAQLHPWAKQHSTAGFVWYYVTQRHPRQALFTPQDPSPPTPPPSSAPLAICRNRCIVKRECSSTSTAHGGYLRRKIFKVAKTSKENVYFMHWSIFRFWVIFCSISCLISDQQKENDQNYTCKCFTTTCLQDVYAE